MRAVIAILTLCFIFLCLKGISGLLRERRPNSITLPPIIDTTVPIAKTLAMIRPSLPPESDVDKPHCRAARHALETVGNLRAHHQAPQGGNIFFEPVGDIEVVLTCVSEPSLGVSLNDGIQSDPHAWGPPARLTDFVVEKGAIMTGAPAKRLRVMTFQCMRDADADRRAMARVRNGSIEVDCTLFRDNGGIASFAVTRH